GHQAPDGLWAVGLETGGGGTWVPISTSTQASQRLDGLMRLDATRDRLLLVGGYGAQTLSGNTLQTGWLNDTWALDLGGTPTWEELAPAGSTPPARQRANGTYDPLHSRL